MERRFVIKDVIPYAPEIPGTDMGEQLGGEAYWRHADCWTFRSDEATRYTLEHAKTELDRLKERCPNAVIYDIVLATEEYRKGQQSMQAYFRALKKAWHEVLEKGLDNSPAAIARMEELFEAAHR
jgi:hypothetical protein